MVLSTELGPRKLGDPSSGNLLLLPEPHTLGEGRAGSALLLSPLQEESCPALPSDPIRQGRGKRPHAKGWCPQQAAELPELELQVQHELQSRGRQATTDIVSSPHHPPFLSTPSSFSCRPCDTGGVSTTEAGGKFTCLPTVPPLSPRLAGGRLQPRRGKRRPRLRSATCKLKATEGQEAHGKQAATW